MNKLKKDINKAEKDIHKILQSLYITYGEDVNFDLEYTTISVKDSFGFSAGVSSAEVPNSVKITATIR